MATGYFTYTAWAVCPIPITYRLGELDSRFGLSEDAARLAIAKAESVWEDATGRNLFTYDPKADFSISFRYDERQALVEAEHNSRAALDQTETVSEELGDQYADLVAKYHELQLAYETEVATYERRLSRHNQAVDEHNAAGGAPPEAYANLEQEAQALEQEAQALETKQTKLNQLVDQINLLGERGNQIIERYNQGVANYNQSFGGTREFTQGTYHSDGRIDIYTFADDDELTLVLAHELGHALSLDHVPGTASVMYFMIGGQSSPLTLSPQDQAAFAATCGDNSGWHALEERVRTWLAAR